MNKGLTVLALLTLVLLVGLLPASSLPISESNLTHPEFPLLYNISIPVSDIHFNQDPAFYSFEAYHIMPPSNVTPIKVVVAQNALFNDSGLTPYVVHVYIPKGNYSLILMNVSILETNGAQYDRPLYIFANGVPIFWGSTQEFLNSTAEADLTLFENLLQGNVTFQLVLENFYDAKIGITGVYYMNVTLYLYPGSKPQGLPNYFIPLYLNKFNYSYQILNPLNDMLLQTVKLPNGTYRLALLLWEEGGGLDEFWYANEPAIREILISYNGRLAGVVNPYETIYTGGIDLFWWKPLTSINTLSFHSPYIVELTPLLATGLTANISVTVTNLLQAFELTGSTAFDWDIAAALLVWNNSANPMVSSKLITAYQRFMDSGANFFGTPSGATEYQEGGSYTLNYSAILYFEHGSEYTNVYQQGRFIATQTFNSIYEQAYLDEKFVEIAKDSGMYNAELYISANYPVLMQFSAIAVPITNPQVIPFNASYEQNGTLYLGLYYHFMYVFNNYNLTIKTIENLTTEGGFGGILEIINAYGGAVLVSLTSNTALTTKTLTSWYLVNGKGFEEIFNAQGQQFSVTNLVGKYNYIHQSFIPITSSS
ncbi:MAG: glycopeptidase [Sulfolobaceae archaeon]|nr:glycopeptidase [Sulfolobaceae archaeon]